ncbi:MAG: hypothetical protein Terrestrivirus3_165 [Terrestrivirus sp.]|uniref:Uncharacterized protein n=1 Tax=Terrestrivirus sp. TaxID=2487775 RepID=A0A3G4ZM25_9VIRU|nr:MAG: hypothetical protein Terrestrivirus3_165 [Terrestrivirus sp.]
MTTKEEIFNVGVTPSSVSISPNGKFAYVTNGNNFEIVGSNSVSVLDLKTRLPITTITDPSFNEPYRSAISSDGTKIYVTNSGSPSEKQGPVDGTVTIIDAKTNTVIGVITGFDGPSGIVLNNDNTIAYVNNYGAPGGVKSGNGTTISVVNLQCNQIINTITVALGPAALVLSDDNEYLYVVSYVDGLPGTGILNIIRTNDNTVVDTISGLSGPFGIALSRSHKKQKKSNKYAYITNFGSNDFAPYGTTVSVVDLKNKKIIKNITTGIQPSGVVASPCGKFVYVSNYNALYAKANFQNLTYGQSTLSIIRVKDNELIKPTISIGETASYLTTDSNGIVYATNYVMNVVRTITL